VFINILQPLGLRPLIWSLSWKNFGRSRAWIEHAAAELNESYVRWEPEPQDFRRLRRKLFNCIRAAREGQFPIGLEQVVKEFTSHPSLNNKDRMAVPFLKKIFQWQKAINEFLIRKEGRKRKGAFGR
jgi:hypothetical protein